MKIRLYAGIVLVNLLLISLFHATFAQINDIRFERLTIDNGLSQNTVMSITQDDQGFLWVATQDGLNRYDGYEFITYTNDLKNHNTLLHNYTTEVLNYGQNRLLVSTIVGLDLVDISSDDFTHLRAGSGTQQLSANDVNCILVDSQGVLWAGTADGLNRIDSVGGEVVYFRHKNNDPSSLSSSVITALFEDHENNLWVGTEEGLNKYSRQKGKFQRYYHANTPNSLSSNYITSIYEDRQKRLWIGTQNGLNIYNHKTNEFELFGSGSHDQNISDNRVTDIFQDSKGHIWVGTRNGLNRLVEAGGKITVSQYKKDEGDLSSLSNNWITTLYEDRSNVLWVGTYFGGLNKFDLYASKFKTLEYKENDPNSLSSNIVRAITKDRDGNIWVGTNPGLNYVDRKTGEVTRFFGDPGNSNSMNGNVVRRLCLDSDNILWIGTSDGGLSWYNTVTGKFRRFEPDPDDPYAFKATDVRMFYEDSDGTMWIGSNGKGLFRYERGTDRFINYRPDSLKNSISSLEVNYAIDEDHDGNLWIGTWNGLNMYNKTTNQWTNYYYDLNDPESLSDNYIKSVLVDHNNTVWVATAGRGLNKLVNREKGIFEHYTVNEGLANNHTYGVLEDDDHYIWVSTNKGLSRLNPITGTFRNYDRNDGLQANEFNTGSFYRAPDGELFFGGINGLNYFRPEEVFDNETLPQVAITSIRLFNKAVELRDSSQGIYLGKHVHFMDKLQLAYHQNSIAFEFAALHFSNPSKNRYAYILEGFDKEWVYTQGSLRFASYTNVPPGEYTFKIKASNNDGIWKMEPATLTLIITPPYWQTWWFKLLSGALLVGLVIGVHRYRVYNIKEQKGRLEKLVEERTAEIDHKSRQLEEKNKKLIAAHEQLQLKQEEVVLINDEVLAQNDEILAQNEELEMQRKQLEKSYKNIRIISEIGREISSMLDFEKIIVKVHEHVTNLMDATEFGIGIYDEESGKINFALCIFKGERMPGYETEVSGNRFTSWAVRNKKPIWLGNARNEYQQYLPSIEEVKNKLLASLMCIPLLVEDRVIGVLSVQSPNENDYSQYQFDLLSALATYIAIGLDNSNAYKTLEAKVDERTRDLNDAYSQLVTTNKNFDEFAYRSAHDLRGPLARILGLCHLGQLEVKDKKGLEFLNFLEKVAFEMDHMLGRLLRTHQNKKTPVTKSLLDIEAILDQIIKSITKTEELHHIKFEYDIDAEISLRSDQFLFRILLENIILNAVQFQDPDQKNKWVKIGVARGQAPGQVVISVTDNGIGIPAQQRERVFDMFFVGSEASKGSGLGLYESKLIADRLGGMVSIKQCNEGLTVFEVVMNK
ncbi:ATP-binding protein [Fulvivirga ulvae]|uniref:two-component regulator propeller domain-containing protein n=1 Tax=Fulvivirga ulvae TaxID=2904245 RepID=UPI001F16A742|nr:two-component regulator propeller domain-containing protein [Fulvivirga ulvae]UII31416.1 ATP-binding protein [Fulvivirga ulvae]